MARAKVILVAADVISHFIATDFGQEVIASSNFRDVAPYCEAIYRYISGSKLFLSNEN